MLDFGYYNMDCLEGMKEFPDKYFDLAIVDPPYGGVKQGGYMTNQRAKHTRYNTALWKQPKPSKEYFQELFRVSKNQIIWGANNFMSIMAECDIDLDVQGWICWHKHRAKGVSFADGELAWTNVDKALRIFDYRWDGFKQEDMKHKEYRLHPSQKPAALYQWLLTNYAKEGDIILDTHVGSASSLIACHRMGFKYVGFELDVGYYKDSYKRLEQEKAQMSIFEYIEGR